MAITITTLATLVAGRQPPSDGLKRNNLLGVQSGAGEKSAFPTPGGCMPTNKNVQPAGNAKNMHSAEKETHSFLPGGLACHVSLWEEVSQIAIKKCGKTHIGWWIDFPPRGRSTLPTRPARQKRFIDRACCRAHKKNISRGQRARTINTYFLWAQIYGTYNYFTVERTRGYWGQILLHYTGALCFINAYTKIDK